MKRKLAFFVIILLFFNLSAMAQTDQEILFRDMPWGTHYNEIEGYFSEFGESSLGTDEDLQSVCNIERIITVSSDAKLERGISGYMDFYPDNLSVAGYSVNSVCFFLVKSVIDGNLSEDNNDMLCYAVRYDLEPSDLDMAASDLIDKLSSLYGTSDDSGTADNTFYHWNYTIWKGENNTGVALAKGKSHNSSYFTPDTININYFTYDGDNWLQSASDIKKKLLEKEREGNTAGL